MTDAARKSNASARDAFQEATVRVNSITWLAGATDGFDDDEFLEEVIFQSGRSNMHQTMRVFSNLPEWVNDEEDFLEWCSKEGLCGFIVNICTPSPVDFFDNGYTTYGYGSTRGTYIYVEDMADVPVIAAKWQEDLISELRELRKMNEDVIAKLRKTKA